MRISNLFNLANILTLINLLSGCMAIVFVFQYRIEWVVYCMAISLLADFLDGFAARLTKSSTDIGKQLDSLADVVSFGALPGAVMFYMISQVLERNVGVLSPVLIYVYSSFAFILTCFAALRLAKFNVDERQSDGFIGLATPGATVFIVGVLQLYLNKFPGLGPYFQNVAVLYFITVAISVLMIAELPMFAFKFKSFAWQGNEIRYLFIILALVLLVVFKLASLSLIVLIYILFSIVQKLIAK